MTMDNDAADPRELPGTPGEEVTPETGRSWDHIGAIIVDAALQRRQNYATTVRPRVLALVEAWPEAATTSGFRKHLGSGKLPDVINWPSPGRLAQVEDMTRVFEGQGIETVQDLRDTLSGSATRTAFREALGLVRHVSAKTLDYIETLSGMPTGPAPDAGVQEE